MGCEWPETAHGIFVDDKGFVYVGGNGTNDHQVVKFKRDGTFMMQIGKSGSRGASHPVSFAPNGTPLLGRPAEMDLDRSTNELYIADGYQNRRIVVVDATTGKYKRHWGAYGNVPNDVKEFFTDRNTLGNGSAYNAGLSPDRAQKYLFNADGENQPANLQPRTAWPWIRRATSTSARWTRACGCRSSSASMMTTITIIITGAELADLARPPFLSPACRRSVGIDQAPLRFGMGVQRTSVRSKRLARCRVDAGAVRARFDLEPADDAGTECGARIEVGSIGKRVADPRKEFEKGDAGIALVRVGPGRCIGNRGGPRLLEFTGPCKCPGRGRDSFDGLRAKIDFGHENARRYAFDHAALASEGKGGLDKAILERLRCRIAPGGSLPEREKSASINRKCPLRGPAIGPKMPP